MTTYKWSILEVFGNQAITKVRFLLKAQDDQNIVETEGYHSYLEGSVNKPFTETKEEDLIRWLEQDTTQNEVNIIKLNLEKQLESLKSSDKAEFPWSANTFTIE
jgi:NADPH-dependent 7-cyano-7-deazaguanine reductase QueF-like protein